MKKARLSTLVHGADHRQFCDEEADTLEISRVIIERCRFFNVGLKSFVCRESSLTHSWLQRVYLRNATFDLADLTGTLFVDCNLRHAVFETTKLDYVEFRHCELDYDQMLSNLPAAPNLKLHLLESLVNNARKMGQHDDEVRLIRRQLKAEREDLAAIVERAPGYYRRTYSTRDQLRSIVLLGGHLLKNTIWGYGLRMTNLFLAASAIIVLFAGFMWWSQALFVTASQTTPRGLSILEALYVSATTFSTVGPAELVPMSTAARAVAAIESLAGGVFLGLVAAAAYRKIAR